MFDQRVPVLGIDIGGTSAKLGVIGPDGNVLWSKQIPFVKGDPEAMLNRIADVVAPALRDHPGIRCAGVSMAGKVDLALGTTQADNLQWYDVPVRSILSARLGMPVSMDNDAQCALIAEWRLGACAGIENVAYLTYGTGVGGGMIINGRPYRGRCNSAAEFGHIITHANGRPCNCGHKGCYEVYASTVALKRMMGGRYTVKQIVDGAKAGEPRMARVFHHYIEEVALGLISIMAVLSPDCVVLGGGLSNAGTFFLDKVRTRMAKCEDWLTKPTTIMLAKFGNDAGMIGAASLARMEFERLNTV